MINLKILGLSLLSALIVLAGNTLAKRKIERIEILESISLMIKYINTQIVYSRLSVPKLLESLEKSGEFSKLSFLSEANTLLSKGNDSGTAWRTAVDDYLKISPLLREDGEMLNAFFNGLGSTDTQGQKSNCETYSELFKQRADGMRKKAEASAKVCNCLGMMAAALVFIILY